MKNREQGAILREAAKWRLLSLLFECPAGNWFEQVAGLAAEVEDTQLKQAAEFARKEAGEGLFHAIFGPGGPAPPREVTYRSWVQPGYLLSELAAIYKAFSYKPANGDVFDHIAVELGFVSYLKLKEAFSIAQGDEEHAIVTAEAAENFVAEHLSKVAEPLANALEFSGIEYLALAGKVLFEYVGKDQDAAKRPLPVIPRTDDELFGCGMSDEFAGVPIMVE